MELLSVSSEEELDQFLGKLIKGVELGSRQRSRGRSAAHSKGWRKGAAVRRRSTRLVHSHPLVSALPGRVAAQ